jgi:hypothetical protein
MIAGLDKELRIYDIATMTVVRSVNCQQPFQFLHKVNPRGHNFEYGVVAEACIGYSYNNFFECGFTIDKGPILEDFQFEELQKMEVARSRKEYKIDKGAKPKAIISYCPFGGDLLLMTPREEQDTIYVYKATLL